MVALDPFSNHQDPQTRLKKLEVFELILSTISDIVLITEADPITGSGPRIVWANQAFEKHTGYTLQEVLGRTPRILQGPETLRTELNKIRQALEVRQPVRAELINYTKSGVKFYSEIDIMPLVDANGICTHFVSVQRDVTQRKVAEERLNEAQRLESISQLTGGVAHDFNNLLTVVLGNAEVLIDHLDLDPLGQGLAQSIMAAAQRGAILTQRLLAVARKQPLTVVTFDLGQLIDGMASLLRATLGDGVELSLPTGFETLLVSSDPAQMEHALLSLLINCRDAIGAQGQVKVTLDRMDVDSTRAASLDGISPGPHARLRVIDNGIGIPMEHQARVFDPFFTTKDVSRGDGLGLAMVYGFVKQSMGDITLDSRPGEGTTVTIYLPLAPVSSLASAADPGQPRAPSQRGRRVVLFVEDDAMVAEYGRTILEDLGFSVIPACNGAEALAVLSSDAGLELLFSDVVMPGEITGLALADPAATLRPDLPVLLVSGYFEHVPNHDQPPSRPFRFLPKPYRRQDLARKLNELQVI